MGRRSQSQIRAEARTIGRHRIVRWLAREAEAAADATANAGTESERFARSRVAQRLFLGTHAENMADMARKGRSNNGPALAAGRPKHGENVHTAKLTTSTVGEIKRRVAAGDRQADLAREFGVSPCTINDIVKGRGWKHVA